MLRGRDRANLLPARVELHDLAIAGDEKRVAVAQPAGMAEPRRVIVREDDAMAGRGLGVTGSGHNLRIG